VQGKNRGRYVFSNSLYINDKTKVLIDTGIGRSVIRKMIKQFGQPDIILYTHAHEDHIPEKDKFTTTKRYIHEKDKPIAESLDELNRMYGVDQLSELNDLMDAFYGSMNFKPLDSVDVFKEDHVFDLGKYQVKVLQTPGHSWGHCCFEVIDQDLIFSGDVDLSRFGPWYGALNGDILAFEASIKKIMKLAPKIIVSSHKEVFFDDIQDHLTAYLNIIAERDERVLNFLEKGKTLEEIVNAVLIYGRLPDPAEFFQPAERFMVEKHLEILMNKGKIGKCNENYKVR